MDPHWFISVCLCHMCSLSLSVILTFMPTSFSSPLTHRLHVIVHATELFVDCVDHYQGIILLIRVLSKHHQACVGLSVWVLVNLSLRMHWVFVMSSYSGTVPQIICLWCHQVLKSRIQKLIGGLMWRTVSRTNSVCLCQIKTSATLGLLSRIV